MSATAEQLQGLLCEHAEYSAICDECDRESTRDSSPYIAAKQAEREGFIVAITGQVVCGTCSTTPRRFR
jgi:hypothetical protein